MMKRYHPATILPGVLLCILLLLTACSTSGGGSNNGNSTPTPTTAHSGSQTSTPTGNSGNGSGTVTPTAQTVAMPHTDTSCPATGTARAAVMRTLALGSHQNLVYIYNEVPQNTSIAFGHLRRFDARTGQKVDITTSGIRIDQAQISADGQWVLFLSIPDPRGDTQHSAMLQLVRMDGQGLQTLYCFPNATYSGHGTSSRLPISIQWSVDQRSIIFSVNTNNDTSAITLLDVATGTLHQLFLDQHDSSYYYSVVTWLDNTHAYIIKQGSSGPVPPATVFLMNVTTATVANPGLTTILTTPMRMSAFSMDSSYDGTKLFTSYCLEAASPVDTTIAVGPATGGTRQTIYHQAPTDCVLNMRAISANTLFMLVQVFNTSANAYTMQVWSMHTDGTGQRTLSTLFSSSTGSSVSFAFNTSSQFPWSNISRDGGNYAVQSINSSTNEQSILTGTLNGGNATAIATTPSGLSTISIAGWTTM